MARDPINAADRFVLCAFLTAAVCAVAALGLEPPGEATYVAVVFAPWIDAGSALSRTAASGAKAVGVGGYHFIVIARADTASYRRLRALGALFIVDAGAAHGCSTSRRQAT